MQAMIEVFKALSDMTRLLIIEMLSCGEMCGNSIIEGLDLSQPTISHHMKILQSAGLVKSEKRGKWVYYSLNESRAEEISAFVLKLMSEKEDCICKRVANKS